jgi:uncharacterized protein YfbU (UPF0304 family)
MRYQTCSRMLQLRWTESLVMMSAQARTLERYKNLTVAVERTLALCRAEIRKRAFDALSEAEKEGVGPVSLPTEFVSVEN